MSAASADAVKPLIQKNAAYQRIATEEAYAPAEMLRLYRKLLDEKGTDDPGFLSQWGYFLGQADRMKVLAERFHNLGEGRIRDMDMTGISRQIVSLTSPGVQIFDAADRHGAGDLVQRPAGGSLPQISRPFFRPGGDRAAKSGGGGQGIAARRHASWD